MTVKKFLLFCIAVFFSGSHIVAFSVRDSIVVRGDNLYPPFEYINEYGKPEGFNVDIIQAVMDEVGSQCDLKLEDWSDVITGFEKGDNYLITASVPSFPDPSLYRFSIPFYTISFSIVSRSVNEFHSINDLRDKVVAVQSNSVSEKYLRNNYITKYIVIVNDMDEAVRMVDDGLCDAALGSDAVIKHIVKKLKLRHLKIHLTDIPYLGYSLVFNTDDDSLITTINRGISNIKFNGVYDQIYDKWFGMYPSYSLEWLLYGGIAIFALVIILFLFILILRKRVEIAVKSYKLSQDKLKEQNMQLSMAFKAGNIVPLTWNMETDIVSSSISDVDLSYISINVNENGTPLSAVMLYVDPEDSKRCTKMFEDFREHRMNNAHEEIRFKKPNSFDRYFSVFLFSDPGNTDSNIVSGYIQDVTAKRLAELTLQKNEQMMYSVLNAIQSPIFVKDFSKGDSFIFWNTASIKTFGDFIMQGIDSFFPQEASQEVYKVDEHVYNSGETYSQREDVTLKSGKILHDLVQKSVIFINNRKLILGVRWDVSEMVKLQVELMQANENIKLILDNIHSGIAYITKDLEVKWENISSFTSHPSLSFCTSKDKKCYQKTKTSAIKTPCSLVLDTLDTKEMNSLDITCDDGKVLEVVSIPIINSSQEIDGVILRVDDITDKTISLHQLEDAKFEAVQADKMKSTFLANMSHEIRTPLNAIVGFSTLLKNAQSEEEKEEFCDIISHSSDSLLKIIDDVLDISKIEAGFIELTNVDFDIAKLFAVLHTTFVPRIKEGIILKCVNPYPACYVNADKNRVTQVITNFMTNAIKFTPKGSITMGYETSDKGFKIYVQDTGIGIPEDKKDKVFKRFERFNNSIEGTGLGLPICKSIMDKAGGSIGFESIEGEGSTFWAIFPSPVHY